MSFFLYSLVSPIYLFVAFHLYLFISIVTSLRYLRKQERNFKPESHEAESMFASSVPDYGKGLPFF